MVGHGRVQRLRADAEGGDGKWRVSIAVTVRSCVVSLKIEDGPFHLATFFCSDNCIRRRPKAVVPGVTDGSHAARTTRDGKDGGCGRATRVGGATRGAGGGGRGAVGWSGGREAYLRLVVLVRGGLLVLVTARAPRQGLTLVHFSAQLERFVWDVGCT